MAALHRALDLLSKGLLFLAVTAGFLMTGFVVLSSLMRYLLGSPFAFTEEIVGLLFVAMAFLGLPWATTRNLHLRITLIPDQLSPRWRAVSEISSTILIIIFCCVFGYFSWEFAETSLRVHARSEMGEIPLFPWMVLMPAMTGLMGLAALVQLVRRLLGDDVQQPGGPPTV
jgi:TRAP-type C4-dicarboxylate transport system permease small subunit